MQRTLILDLDGTLVDSVNDLTTALNNTLRPRRLPLADRGEVTRLVGNGARVLLEKAFAARDAAFNQAALDEFLVDYTAHAAIETRPFPGAVDALQAMAAEGWRFAVCTNKPEAAARALLDALELTPWLAAIGGGDSFPTRKPDPAHLLSTLAAAGGTRDAAVMVGDHENDVHAAAGAGIPCIFAAWGYGPLSMAAGNPVAQGFADLPGMCEALLAQPVRAGA